MQGLLYSTSTHECTGELEEYTIHHVCIGKKAHVHISDVTWDNQSTPRAAPSCTITTCDLSCRRSRYEIPQSLNAEVIKFLTEAADKSK